MKKYQLNKKFILKQTWKIKSNRDFLKDCRIFLNNQTYLILKNVVEQKMSYSVNIIIFSQKWNEAVTTNKWSNNLLHHEKENVRDIFKDCRISLNNQTYLVEKLS